MLGDSYTYYYTASDCKIFLSSPSTGRMVLLDKALGIGYSSSISSVPIYTLGSSKASFFSKGNFLGQGMLVIPFFDERYLKTSLQYIFDEMPTKVGYTEDPNNSAGSKINFGQTDPSTLDDETFRSQMNASYETIDSVVAISSIISEFDILIVLDSSTPFKNSLTKSLTLKGVKLTSESMEINSQQDGLLQTGYKFYFKDIKR